MQNVVLWLSTHRHPWQLDHVCSVEISRHSSIDHLLRSQRECQFVIFTSTRSGRHMYVFILKAYWDNGTYGALEERDVLGCFRLLLRGQKSLIGGLPEDGPLFVLPRAVGLALLSSAGNITDEFILCSLVTLAFSEFIVERIILHTHAHIGPMLARSSMWNHEVVLVFIPCSILCSHSEHTWLLLCSHCFYDAADRWYFVCI